MAPIVHLVRHGQGFHQLDPLSEHRQIHDAHLTDLGITRCKDFDTKFPDYIAPTIELVCASPLRRAIQTAQYCFASIIPQTTTGKILLVPLAQEDSAEPCDVGNEASVLEEEFGEAIDTELLTPGWYKKEGMNAAEPSALKARAREFRRWVKARPEKVIVVVGHGAFWQYVVGEDPEISRPWDNREWRWYHFDAEDGDEALMIEEQQSVLRRRVLM